MGVSCAYQQMNSDRGGTAERLAVGEERAEDIGHASCSCALARMGLLLLFLFIFISCRRLFHPGTIILFARFLGQYSLVKCMVARKWL
jgi:hypothetical protein